MVITVLIAAGAFFLSLYNFWFSHFRRLKVAIQPDDEIRLRQFPGQTGWSVLFVINVSGPESKWAILKFTKTNFTAPDGHAYALLPMSHVADRGIQQQSSSRNIPLAIKGGDSKTVIIGYQSSQMTKWQEGEYEVTFAAVDSRGEYVTIQSRRFILDGPRFTNLQNPANDQLVVLLPSNEATSI